MLKWREDLYHLDYTSHHCLGSDVNLNVCLAALFRHSCRTHTQVAQAEVELYSPLAATK